MLIWSWRILQKTSCLIGMRNRRAECEVEVEWKLENVTEVATKNGISLISLPFDCIQENEWASN